MGDGEALVGHVRGGVQPEEARALPSRAPGATAGSRRPRLRWGTLPRLLPYPTLTAGDLPLQQALLQQSQPARVGLTHKLFSGLQGPQGEGTPSR